VKRFHATKMARGLQSIAASIDQVASSGTVGIQKGREEPGTVKKSVNFKTDDDLVDEKAISPRETPNLQERIEGYVKKKSKKKK